MGGCRARNIPYFSRSLHHALLLTCGLDALHTDILGRAPIRSVGMTPFRKRLHRRARQASRKCYRLNMYWKRASSTRVHVSLRVGGMDIGVEGLEMQVGWTGLGFVLCFS